LLRASAMVSVPDAPLKPISPACTKGKFRPTLYYRKFLNDSELSVVQRRLPRDWDNLTLPSPP
jgi:hypothetical protein